MTFQDFLAWEDKQPLRYEFDGFRPAAMTGGTSAHAAIQRNLIFALTRQGRGLGEGVADQSRAILSLPEIGLNIPLAELYADAAIHSGHGAQVAN